MNDPIDEGSSLSTEPERHNTPRRTSGTVRHKRTSAAVPIPTTSPSPRQDEDIPRAKKRRLLTREVEATNQQKNHNSNKEYMQEWNPVAAIARLNASMQLSGLSQWHPSTFPTTGVMGVSIADQVNILQMRDGMSGHAGTVAPGTDQTTSPLGNGWSPRGSDWHPTIAQATNLAGMPTVNQLNLLQIPHGMSGHAGTLVPGQGQTPIPFLNGRSSRGSDWHPTIAQATDLTGMPTVNQLDLLQIPHGMSGHAGTVEPASDQTPIPFLNGRSPWGSDRHPTIAQARGRKGVLTVDQLDLLQILNGMNRNAGTVMPGLGQPTSTSWHGRSSRDRALDPTIAQAAGLIGITDMQTADQGYASLARSPYQATTISSPWYGSSSRDSAGNPTVAHAAGIPGVPCWNGLGSRDSAWNPTVTHTAGLPDVPGMQPTEQDSILEARQQIGNNWDARLALDPCRTTTRPSQNRLDKAVDTPVDRTTGRAGRWTTEETDIDFTTAEHKGNWTPAEDRMLLHAAEKFSVSRWKQIAALIPGRTKKQCWNRWQYALDPSIVRMTERTGKWSTEEDGKLVGAVQKYNGENWDAIAALVPSRTKRQCMDRWHKCKSVW
jgi:hypothetical protein